MVSTIKKSLYTVAWLAFSAQYALAQNSSSNAAWTFWQWWDLAWKLNWWNDLVATLQ